MKLVLFSDLHLDAPFAWLGSNREGARRRRQALRDTLLRIAGVVREEGADALLCAGDLFEHERVSEDTGEFLKATFAHLHPLPVFLAPGNHDWFGPRSLYHRVEWSDNVRVFTEDRLKPATLDDGLTLWGAAHRAPANTDDFLDGFRVGRGGVNVALFHGSLRWGAGLSEEGKEPHAPFRLEQVAEAGLRHAFLGHFHTPSSSPFHTYPGNPDPLTFGEDGRRGAAVATIGQDGTVSVEIRPVAVTRCHDLTLDVTGCASVQQVRDALFDLLCGRAGVARVTLVGEVAQQVDLHLADLENVPSNLDGLAVCLGAVTATYDFDAIGREQTVRGQFVRDVLAASLAESDRRRVLVTGLRALQGRDDLEVA